MEVYVLYLLLLCEGFTISFYKIFSYSPLDLRSIPGKWSKDLGNLLRGLVRAFTKQVALQGPTPEPCQAILAEGMQSAFVEAVMRLASRAQFSKDRGARRLWIAYGDLRLFQHSGHIA